MSISLVGVMIGLPIALAMRGVMGKEKFEQWLEASDYILYTNFCGEDEMKRIVQASGYDVTEWAGLLKTHLTQRKSSYFCWEEKNGKIIAKMSVYDEKEDINKFINKVEKTAGRKIFFEKGRKEEEASTQKSERKEVRTTKNEYRESFPTIYVDADLVRKILEQYQIKVLLFQDNLIQAEYECYKMTFNRSSIEEPFDINIVSDSNKMKALYSCLDNLNEEYYASMQEKSYLYIKEQLEEEGLEIEEEEVLEDNSIVITVSV